MLDEILKLKNDGLSYAAISKKLNIPIGTIKSLVSRNKKKETPKEHTCKWCGKELIDTPHHKSKVFCSDECKRKWWNKNRITNSTKSKIKIVCHGCGVEFFDYAKRGRKYCSDSCYKKVRYGR